MTRCLAALLVGIALGATGPVARADVGEPDVQEMGQLFDALCLHAFPAPAALDAQAAHLRMTPMTALQVQNYLHQDPGRGWYYRTPLARYAITIELPPIPACAIRRMTPAGVPSVTSYLAAINGYAATRNQAIVGLPPQNAKTADGADLSAFAQAIQAPDGRSATDVFMVILTNYHGRFRGELADGVGTGPGVEVRFVHQFPPRK